MNQLSTENLKGYLYHVRDLEVACYEQKDYIKHLHSLLYKAEYPIINQEIAYYPYTRPSFLNILKICAGLGVIISAIIMFFLFYRLDGYSLVGSIAGAIIGGSIAGVINGALLSPLGYLIAIGVNAAITKIRNSKIDLENREISADNDVIIAQSHKRADLILVEIKKANQKYMETKDVLAQFYSKGIVYQKYHGLVPITMFCEYIASGRCTTLTGHEGAYNIYENEIRLDLILTKLDDIIEQLKQIKQRQYMLADLIEKSNREITKLTKIVSVQTQLLQNIETNTALSAYYDGITARNTTYLAWLEYHNL